MRAIAGEQLARMPHTKENIVGILTKILQAFLGLAFLGAGGQKLAGADQMVEDFDRFGYPQWFMYATGTIEITGALGMLVGLARPVVAPFAGLLLAATMTGALATHIRMKDPAQKMVPPTVLLTLSSVVLARRFAELRAN